MLDGGIAKYKAYMWSSGEVDLTVHKTDPRYMKKGFNDDDN